MVKNTVKFFEWENKFHSYLTGETLSAEEKVSIIDDHGKSSSQTFADGAVRKVVLMKQSRAQGNFGSLSAVYSPNDDPQDNTVSL